MKPPEGINIKEDTATAWWIDEKGIICGVSKKNGIDISREEMISQFEDFKKANHDKKVCLIFDISNAQPGKKMNKDREILLDELDKVIKAMAIISSSSLGRLLANLFFNLKSPTYPMKIFTSEKEAREWIEKFNV